MEYKENEINQEILDVLSRDSFIDNVIRFIEYYSNKKESVAFAIQGAWGCGKTWIIDKIYNKLYDIQDFNITNSKYCLFIYNAWDYDYYDEPLISLFISLYNQLNEEKSILIKNPETRKKVITLNKSIKNVLMNRLNSIPVIGDIIDLKKSYDNELDKNIDNIRRYDFHYDINKFMEQTITAFNEISKKRTIVLFIDELDRCLPEYAIKVLERIHHIKQSVDNIEVVYSIDKEQISEVIKTTFGDKENSTRGYLSKFIDFSLKIPNSSYNYKIKDKYKELFVNFSFIYSKEDLEIFDMISDLIPDFIPIRIVENMLKKIILINNQLNQSCEKLDYSILITELFVAIAEELKINWEKCSFQYNETSEIVDLVSKVSVSVYKLSDQLIELFRKVTCKNIYTTQFRSPNFFIKIEEKNNKVQALVVFYIARIIKLNNFRAYKTLNFLIKNEKYLQDFFFIYKALEM